MQRLADGDYSVDGGMSIHDLNELLDLDLPDDHWETVAGFMFGTLEHVPVAGESVTQDGWRFTATEVEGRRIRRVKVSLEADAQTRCRSREARDPLASRACRFRWRARSRW